MGADPAGVSEERILILAPIGRDSEVLRLVLGRAGLAVQVCDLHRRGRRRTPGADRHGHACPLRGSPERRGGEACLVGSPAAALVRSADYRAALGPGAVRQYYYRGAGFRAARQRVAARASVAGGNADQRGAQRVAGAAPAISSPRSPARTRAERSASARAQCDTRRAGRARRRRAASGRGGPRPGAENGGARAPYRRGRARFQQSADRDRRQSRIAPVAASAIRREAGTGWPKRRSAARSARHV